MRVAQKKHTCYSIRCCLRLSYRSEVGGVRPKHEGPLPGIWRGRAVCDVSSGCVSLSHGNQDDHKGWRSVWDLNESGGGTSHGLLVGRGALLFIHTCKLLALGTRHPDSVSWLQGNSISCFGCRCSAITFTFPSKKAAALAGAVSAHSAGVVLHSARLRNCASPGKFGVVVADFDVSLKK